MAWWHRPVGAYGMAEYSPRYYGWLECLTLSALPAPWAHTEQESWSVVPRGENGTYIFRPYSRPNSFRGVQIYPYLSSDIQHTIPYPYPNTEIAYLWCRYPIISYPAWLILSVFEYKSRLKYENKYNISDIRSYLIRFHPYSLATKRLLLSVLWILFLQCFIVVILEITEIIGQKLQSRLILSATMFWYTN